jgi:hypothetical protein
VRCNPFKSHNLLQFTESECSIIQHNTGAHTLVTTLPRWYFWMNGCYDTVSHVFCRRITKQLLLLAYYEHFKIQWFLYASSSFGILRLCSTHRGHLYFVLLTTNCDVLCVQHCLTGFCNGDVYCATWIEFLNIIQDDYPRLRPYLHLHIAYL